MKKLSCMFLAGTAIVAPAVLCQQQNPGPVKAFPDPGVITTRQQITPAGIQSVFEGAVYGAIFDRDPSLIWVLNSNQLIEVNWRSNRAIQRIAVHGDPGLQGLRYDDERRQVLYTEAMQSTTRKPPQPFWKYTIHGNDVQLFSAGTGGQKLIAAGIGTESSGALDISGHTAAIPDAR